MKFVKVLCVWQGFQLQEREYTGQEMLSISIGLMRATVPNTSVVNTITAPMRAPINAQALFLFAETKAKYKSGRAFPRATPNIPTTITGISNRWAKYEMERTIPSAERIIKKMPNAIF